MFLPPFLKDLGQGLKFGLAQLASERMNPAGDNEKPVS